MKQYPLTTSYKLYYSSISLLLLIPSIGFAYLFRYITVCYLPFILLVIVAIIRAGIWLRNERIIISEKSIIYRTIDITVECFWQDVKSIRNVFINRLFTKQECLVIDLPQMKILRSSIFGIFFHHTNWTMQLPVIPLSCFSNNWRNAEIGRQIKEYAPHLFVKEKSA